MPYSRLLSIERIVLGPPKMSFASSSLGGLKRSEDGLSGFKKSLEVTELLTGTGSHLPVFIFGV